MKQNRYNSSGEPLNVQMGALENWTRLKNNEIAGKTHPGLF